MSPKLRHRISFTGASIVRDTNGDRSQVFLPVSALQNVPAEVLTGASKEAVAAGKEAVAAGQPVSSVAARITCRWQSELAEPYGLRITHGADVYHVETHYTDATGARWVTLVCSKGARDD